MDTGQNIESTLADLTGLDLDGVRGSQDELLTDAIRRMVSLVHSPDHRFGDSERRRLD
ncbi:hypothetical protein [Pseudofrankia asymbiotica]|uniref:hypothetical protein n=1 Tax=Pseudofrankia asymbiotica TaxID=1834516 RepID=UPI0013042ACE|nr:hypothetical protein [Pseudofrankia asymbiotica]